MSQSVQPVSDVINIPMALAEEKALHPLQASAGPPTAPCPPRRADHSQPFPALTGKISPCVSLPALPLPWGPCTCLWLPPSPDPHTPSLLGKHLTVFPKPQALGSWSWPSPTLESIGEAEPLNPHMKSTHKSSGFHGLQNHSACVWVLSLLLVWPWTSHLTSEALSFPHL